MKLLIHDGIIAKSPYSLSNFHCEMMLMICINAIFIIMMWLHISLTLCYHLALLLTMRTNWPWWYRPNFAQSYARLFHRYKWINIYALQYINHYLVLCEQYFWKPGNMLLSRCHIVLSCLTLYCLVPTCFGLVFRKNFDVTIYSNNYKPFPNIYIYIYYFFWMSQLYPVSLTFGNIHGNDLFLATHHTARQGKSLRCVSQTNQPVVP